MHVHRAIIVQIAPFLNINISIYEVLKVFTLLFNLKE